MRSLARYRGIADGIKPHRSSPIYEYAPQVLGWKSGTGCSMLVAEASPRRPTHATTNRDGFNEEKRFSQGHRYWRGGRCYPGRPRHRAVDAGTQMAPDGELAKIARHAVGRRRGDGQARCRSHRQQVPDPDLRRRRNRSGPAGARCRAERHRRDGTHGVLLLLRQGSDVCVRHGGAVRPQPAPQPGLVHAGRRQGSCSTSSTRATTSRRFWLAIPVARWAAGSARRSTPSTT